jgi:hypothetical protein
MEISAAELDLLAEMVTQQYERLQRQATADVFMLGGALHIIKGGLPHKEYRRFVEERLPFGMQVARKITGRGSDYLINQLAADAAAAAAKEGN